MIRFSPFGVRNSTPPSSKLLGPAAAYTSEPIHSALGELDSGRQVPIVDQDFEAEAIHLLEGCRKVRAARQLFGRTITGCQPAAWAAGVGVGSILKPSRPLKTTKLVWPGTRNSQAVCRRPTYSTLTS